MTQFEELQLAEAQQTNNLLTLILENLRLKDTSDTVTPAINPATIDPDKKSTVVPPLSPTVTSGLRKEIDELQKDHLTGDWGLSSLAARFNRLLNIVAQLEKRESVTILPSIFTTPPLPGDWRTYVPFPPPTTVPAPFQPPVNVPYIGDPPGWTGGTICGPKVSCNATNEATNATPVPDKKWSGEEGLV